MIKLKKKSSTTKFLVWFRSEKVDPKRCLFSNRLRKKYTFECRKGENKTSEPKNELFRGRKLSFQVAKNVKIYQYKPNVVSGLIKAKIKYRNKNCRVLLNNSVLAIEKHISSNAKSFT
jgi:hypothetical protein